VSGGRTDVLSKTVFCRFDGFARRLALAGGLVFALFLVIAPFEHHDLACHLKTPRHCTSCASSVVGADPSSPATPGACRLVDAGLASSRIIAVDGTLLAVRTTGRSPPSAA